MIDVLAPGPRHRESEFRVPGVFGTCGPNSCAMAEWCVTGTETHTEDVYARMRAAGLCAPNGASASTDWAAYFRSRGLLLTAAHYYASNVWPGYRAFLEGLAGDSAIVLELAAGQQLHDSVSGAGENAVNLQYHIICVYGVGSYGGADGAWCADGDNWAAGDVLQFYPWSVLDAALPCAAVAIGVPMTWHQQTDGTGRDDAGHACGAGFMSYIEAHGLASADGLMSETYYTGDHSFLPLNNGACLAWDGKGVAENGAGVVVNLWNMLEAADARTPQTVPAPLTAYQQACIAFAESAMATSSAEAAAAALRGK